MSDRTPTALTDDAALRAIAEGVEAETGDRFFSSLVRSLAVALDVRYAFVTQLSDDATHFKTLALWEHDHFRANVEIPLRGTPCEDVLRGETAHYPKSLCERFPTDDLLAEWSAQSYCGVPVFDALGRVFGHVAIIDDKPMPDGPRGIAVMRIFAARVRAEIERLRMENALREANERLAESEERFRDFFEEAPITYMIAGFDSRLVRANRAATRILGVRPDEIAGMDGKSLFADTREGQHSLRKAMESIEHGTDPSGLELELRRKDDGRPLWIHAWSRPEAGERYTRTMFIDITDRVLMEQEKTRLQTQNEYLQALIVVCSRRG
jgi:formate hydrogenlyase transcriptional activator